MLPLFLLLAASPVPAESHQLVLSVSAGWDATRSILRLYERSGPQAPWSPVGVPIEGALGRTGLAWGRGLHPAALPGPGKREGDGKSPAGVFDLRLVTGYAPAPPAGTRLPYRQATSTLVCVDDPRSSRYNQLVDEAQVSRDWSSAEDMRRPDDLYRLLVWVGHNDAAAEAGGGSCIFLHLRERPDATTSGCTAFDAEPMQRLLHWLEPEARPVLVQLPDAEYRSRAAAWGLPAPRPRARDLGLAPGVFAPGPLDAITDVAGVRVGQVTLVEGDAVRTGVTAILPHGGNLFAEKVPGAIFVGNAFGKLAGSTQVRELGTIETPIVLTNTLAVGTAVEAVVAWTLAQPGNEDVRSVNALVGETNDGGLSDIRSMPVRREHVLAALSSAVGGPVAEGSVGAGTGTVAFGWKGGIGTASRLVPLSTGDAGRLPESLGRHTLGVLVQANFGGVLSMDGVPVGRELGRYAFGPEPPSFPITAAGPGGADGSCMIVVATDAPLSAHDLERLAARALFGLARTGSSFSNGSGDYAIAFSTAPERRVRPGALAPRTVVELPAEALSPLFEAALEATEEAVLNALLRATTLTGSGRTVEAIPIDRVRAALAKHGKVLASFHPCPVPGAAEGVLCGTVEVPEDRSHRGGRLVPLHVVVVRATAPEKREDPLFILAGGPGVAATGMTRFILEEAFAPLGRNRDVVFVDIRGTGRSNPLDCDLPGSDEQPAGYFADFMPVEAIEACRRKLEAKADLTLYNTPVIVEDLEEVRRALGYDRVNLYGTSYGTRVALEWMRRHPAALRAVVLDGVVPPSLTMPASHAPDGEASLRAVIARCEVDPACRGAFPDLEGDLRTVVERLEKGRVTTSIPHPRTGEPVAVALGRGLFGEAVRHLLYSPARIVRLPWAIHRAAAGDFTEFARLTFQYARGVRSALSMGLLLSVTCAEDLPYLDLAEARRRAAGTLLGSYRIDQQVEACRRWPSGEVAAEVHAPVRSDVPTLLLSGELDPVTPPRNAEEVARTLTRARRVTVPGGSHSGDTGGCLERLMSAFVESASPNALDVSCVSTTPFPAWQLGKEKKAASPSQGPAAER
jgi:D-aminopeptidase